MKTVEVSTVIYAPPEDVFDFLLDFPGYARYSSYIDSVRVDGDGSPGTAYHVRFSWWKLSYTLHSRVTRVEAPTRLDWEVTRDLDAEGRWRLETSGVDPDDHDAACRLSLEVTFDAGSAEGVLDLPRFVSFDWVADRVVGLVAEEGERVVERVVADLEGSRRAVDVDVTIR